MAAAGGIPNFPRQQAAPGPMVTFIRYFSPVLILIYFQWEPEPITEPLWMPNGSWIANNTQVPWLADEFQAGSGPLEGGL